MNTESLYQAWVRLGVNFPGFVQSSVEPLVEELIAQTSIIGRYEPRLIECMAGWIDKHGDLVNTSLLHKFIAHSDSAVIGLILDLLNSKEMKKLKKLTKYCSPKEKAEFLFYTTEGSATMKAEAVETATELNGKWNLFYVALRVKSDAVLNRKEVLKRCPNLLRRALFGEEMRTEILNHVITHDKSYTAEIANKFGYGYPRVFAEIQELIRNGIFIDSFIGKKRIVTVNPTYMKLFSELAR